LAASAIVTPRKSAQHTAEAAHEAERRRVRTERMQSTRETLHTLSARKAPRRFVMRCVRRSAAAASTRPAERGPERAIINQRRHHACLEAFLKHCAHGVVCQQTSGARAQTLQ